MRTLAALAAKNRFGELLDFAQRGPVTIEKHGRAVAVVLSAEDYRELEGFRLDRLRREVGKGLSDLKAGRTVTGAAVFREARKRLR
ncbi:MAG: type II toxin-antitoxin system Phd/YefM family antitoxin [Alphaproteobacteria bacterium]